MSVCYPKRPANLASRVLKGEAIIMNPADSSLFNLNETATAIWLLYRRRTTSCSEIVEREKSARVIREGRSLESAFAHAESWFSLLRRIPF